MYHIIHLKCKYPKMFQMEWGKCISSGLVQAAQAIKMLISYHKYPGLIGFGVGAGSSQSTSVSTCHIFMLCSTGRWNDDSSDVLDLPPGWTLGKDVNLMIVFIKHFLLQTCKDQLFS
jgi:hypothetical protein